MNNDGQAYQPVADYPQSFIDFINMNEFDDVLTLFSSTA